MQNRALIHAVQRIAPVSLLLILSGIFTTPLLADEFQTPTKRTYVGLTLGLPLPIGGIGGIAVNRRIDANNFADIGVSSIGILHSAYVSWGNVTTPGRYTLFGFDANVVYTPGSSGAFSFPGIHFGGGWEWFVGEGRLAVAIVGGFPWLFGGRFTAGF